jgi:hypothetical protein
VVGDERNETAFTVEGYVSARTPYADAVAEVVGHLERDIAFVPQLTREQYRIAKEREFRNV